MTNEEKKRLQEVYVKLVNESKQLYRLSGKSDSAQKNLIALSAKIEMINSLAYIFDVKLIAD